jgi:hypothetical protein
VATVIVPSRFNGPPASGQGGYSSAVLAAHLDGPAAVSLRRPIPLDQELEVRVENEVAEEARDGATRDDKRAVARAFDGAGELIAAAVPAPPLAPWDLPPVSPDTAHRAKKRFTLPAGGTFDHCFVCGRERHDGFDILLGPVAGTDLVAAPWTPPEWSADSAGEVLPEFVCAALDCPGYFALHAADLVIAFLARQQSEVHTPLRAGVEYVAVGRPLGRAGRKGFAATAILDADGVVLAQSEQLVIVPREAMSHG